MHQPQAQRPISPAIDGPLKTENSAPLKPKCFRISNIPDSWNEDDLRRSLEELDPPLRDLHDFTLSLYPACHGFHQVATLNLPQPTEYFRRIESYKSFLARVDNQDLFIDCDFNGLTPFNTPPDEIIAE
jgi:hypothetical protein